MTDEIGNYLLLACFSAAFFGLLAVVDSICRDYIARHKRKIQRFFGRK